MGCFYVCVVVVTNMIKFQIWLLLYKYYWQEADSIANYPVNLEFSMDYMLAECRQQKLNIEDYFKTFQVKCVVQYKVDTKGMKTG